MKRVLIIGATSAIAEAVARHYAAAAASLFLVARNAEKLAIIAEDLQVRGAVRLETAVLDMADLAAQASVITAAVKFLGQIDTVLVAYGTLPLQRECEQDRVQCLEAWNVNATSVIALLQLLANYFEQQQQGTLAVITSVAGDRGRRSNYLYGAAKAAVSTFLSGLTVRLAAVGVNVLDIKPGFVDTPMTRDFKKGLLWVQADYVAKKIIKAIALKQQCVYIPGFWRWIMLIIRCLPMALFKKLQNL